MSSVYTVKRPTADGKARYHVRYRPGGRGTPILHGGAFKTKKEADARVAFIRGELAAGRDPMLTLAGKVPAQRETVAVWCRRYQDARVDVELSTLRTYGKRVALITPTLGDRDPRSLTIQDVQTLVSTLVEAGLKVSYVRNVIGLLAMVLDEANIDPNPARSRRVRYPKVEKPIPVVPSGAELELIVRYSRHRECVRLLAWTGMRVAEATALTWADVDERGGRVLVRRGKTATARRWVLVPDHALEPVSALLARDDRQADTRIWPVHPNTIGSAIRQACKAAGIAHYHPHDLRHRYASVMAKLGVPRTDLMRQLGHAKASQLDVYEHVVPDLADEELELWLEVAGRLGRLERVTIEEVPA